MLNTKEDRLLFSLKDKSKSEKILNRIVAENTDYFGDCIDEFPKGIYELISMSPERLELIIRYMGACLCVGLIKKCILSSQIKTIKDTIGPDVYQFILQESDNFVKGIKAIQQYQVVLNEDNIAGALQKASALCLLALINDMPQNSKKRLFVRLPKSYWDCIEQEIETVAPLNGINILYNRIQSELI